MKARTMQRSLLLITLALGACGGSGGGSSSGGGHTGPMPPQQEGPAISGLVTGPNASTPIPSAAVWLPNTSQLRMQGLAAPTVTNPGACNPPDNTPYWTCTDAEGRFSLPYGELQGEVELHIRKGSWNSRQTVTLSGADVPLSPLSLGMPRIAVVEGHYDHVEHLLAKMGLGELEVHPYVSGQSRLKAGTERFDILSAAELEEKVALDRLTEYDLLYLNCGIESHVFQPGEDQSLEQLRRFVQQGGTLYATDWELKVIRAAFPDALTSDEGWEGQLDQLIGTVDYPELADWLAAVPCDSGQCVSAQGDITLYHFLSGWRWGVPNPTLQPSTLVKADVDQLAQAPMTWSFRHGQGRVIFSAYHTADDHTHASDYLPQERILEYLFYHDH